VTNQVRAQQEIQKLTEQLAKRVIDLAQANEDLEAFNYTLSHDLRTPLSIISTQCHLIRQEEQAGNHGNVQDRVDKVKRASGKMADLIESVLALSRATREPLHIEHVDLSAIAATIVDDLRGLDPGRAVSIEIEKGLEVWGDPKMLYQLLVNLVGNAWKYTHDRAVAEIRIGARMDRGEQVFYVRDNGCGFDMSQAGGLFEPFKRLAGSKGFKGTGIGLATVRKILDRHSGHVWADAKLGEGATFFFTLGTTEPEPVAPPESTPRTH
jgi:light-regulated signal transduction histidine kinase (bacteriophytochrome)